jgi:hypothetical protein
LPTVLNNQPVFFICHYRPNIDRRNYLFDSFVNSEKSIQWIMEYDKEKIEPEIKSYYLFSVDNYFKIIAPQLHILLGHAHGLSNFIPWKYCFEYAQELIKSQGGVLPEWLMPKELSPGDVSICLKHRRAWECIVESGLDYGCVLEDDFIVRESSLQELNEVMKRLPAQWDYIDIAGGAGLHVREEKQVAENIYRMEPPRGRTACGYLINRKFCERILALDCPITLGIDWQFNYLFLALEAKVFWIEPTIFLHGSEAGFYSTHRQ